MGIRHCYSSKLIHHSLDFYFPFLELMLEKVKEKWNGIIFFEFMFHFINNYLSFWKHFSFVDSKIVERLRKEKWKWQRQNKSRSVRIQSPRHLWNAWRRRWKVLPIRETKSWMLESWTKDRKDTTYKPLQIPLSFSFLISTLLLE